MFGLFQRNIFKMGNAIFIAWLDALSILQLINLSSLISQLIVYNQSEYIIVVNGETIPKKFSMTIKSS